MPHSKKFRLGWQSENIARSILYQFCFVAEPFKSADDIGVDFVCTAFEERNKKNDTDLIPRDSFALQAKSNKQRFSITKWLPFFARLNMPFHVGVVDRENQKLTLYSGEYLLHFFAHVGHIEYEDRPPYVEVELCQRKDLREWITEPQPGRYRLKFPEITTIRLDDTKEQSPEFKRALQEIEQVNKMIRTNLVRMRNNWFTFLVYGSPAPQTYITPDSANSFEENSINNLADVFWNLWNVARYPEYAPKAQQLFAAYEKFYFEIQSIQSNNPFLKLEMQQLNHAYREAKIAIENSRHSSV